MTGDEFHDLFQTLTDAFPNSRIGESVERTWHRKLLKFPHYKIKHAFGVLMDGERFPTLGAVMAEMREAHESRVSYVIPSDQKACNAAVLGNDPLHKCGCRECQPQIYIRFSKKQMDTYGRYPWEGNDKGPAELRADELVRTIGGKEAFDQLRKELARRPKERSGSGFKQITEVRL